MLIYKIIILRFTKIKYKKNCQTETNFLFSQAIKETEKN